MRNTEARPSIAFNANSSVLVFGAHPDDAVRSCGGVIQRARAAGARVTIVKATDGAALGGPARIPIARKQARARRREELRALKVLGFPRKNHVLLGFPDAGLESMRTDYFEKTGLPYQCPWLDADRTQGREVFRAGATFFGATLAAILRDIVVKARPTHVFTHHHRLTGHAGYLARIDSYKNLAGVNRGLLFHARAHNRRFGPDQWHGLALHV